jgi:hypothetical protein
MHRSQRRRAQLTRMHLQILAEPDAVEVVRSCIRKCAEECTDAAPASSDLTGGFKCQGELHRSLTRG